MPRFFSNSVLAFFLAHILYVRKLFPQLSRTPFHDGHGEHTQKYFPMRISFESHHVFSFYGCLIWLVPVNHCSYLSFTEIWLPCPLVRRRNQNIVHSEGYKNAWLHASWNEQKIIYWKHSCPECGRASQQELDVQTPPYDGRHGIQVLPNDTKPPARAYFLKLSASSL